MASLSVRNSPLINMAAFVIVVAGMKAAAPLVVPFLLAVFLAIICAPPVFWLQKRGLPEFVGMLLMISVILGVWLSLVTLIGSSMTDFSSNVPKYQQNLLEQTAGWWQWLDKQGITLDRSILTDTFNPGKLLKMAANTLNGLGGMLTNTFVIFLTFFFILSEAAGFPCKLRAIQGEQSLALVKYSEIAQGVNRYLGIKTLTSLVTGVTVALGLSLQGLDYAIMWGVVAFFFNFIPNIGSIIAAIPAVLLSLVQLGWGAAILTGGIYFVVNIVIGSIIEPRVMGKGVGLSVLVVFLSLAFWGWVLGPVGMLLSVPLTMAVRIALEGTENTRWLAILLASNREINRRKKNEAEEEKE
ncbi:MAG TPA: AI-2E family transporter [Desulfocapsa sulfexigens]|nr:AI-2E family transporter [Desulfocapsa sulfexigens]